MSETAKRTVGSDLTSGHDATSGSADPSQINVVPHRSRGGDVLFRDHFLMQLNREKRRADRSRAPLSLVVMNFAAKNTFDKDDYCDIMTDLSLSTRETDLIGCLGDGVFAFLLPYSDVKAAETFSRLIVGRINTPAANVRSASYPDADFDTLLVDSLAEIETSEASAPSKPRENISSLGIKRAIDVVGAIALLILASPLMLATAIAVKMTSPGPVIFRQMRIGREGKPFTFYKFRSMRCDNDDAIHREYVRNLIQGRHDEINEGDADNPLYKLQTDARITPFGRIIRRTSVDELPQLWNVLKGEMSLVGPRPPIAYETESYQSWHMRRLQEVRPGITGLWQVEGRSTTTFDEMVRLDLRYIRNWSLWLDIKILFKTVIVVINCNGAD